MFVIAAHARSEASSLKMKDMEGNDTQGRGRDGNGRTWKGWTMTWKDVDVNIMRSHDK